MSAPDGPSKVDLVLRWIPHGLVRIHFDASNSRAKVPPHLRAVQDCCLEFGFDMPIPIPDLKIDQESISGTLHFFTFTDRVELPWDVVFAIESPTVDKMAVDWRSIPAAVMQEMLERGSKKTQRTLKGIKGPKKVQPKQPRFKVLQGGKK